MSKVEYAMNSFQIHNYDIKAKGPLAKAIQEYRERKIPMSNLVSHYAFNYLPKSDRQKAANPFEIYDYIAAEKELTGRNIEHGRTVQETAYEYAAWDINASKISPTTLITAYVCMYVSQYLLDVYYQNERTNNQRPKN